MTRVIKFTAVAALMLGLSSTARAEATKGTIKSADTVRNEIIIKGIVKDTTYGLTKDASVWLDGKRTKLGDLKADDTATVTYSKQGDNLMASDVRALRNAKETTGTVRDVFKDKREVTLKGAIKDSTYELDKNGTVYIDGKKANLADIRAGDEVLVTYEKKGDHWMAADISVLKRK